MSRRIKNSELLAVDKQFLGELDRQRQYVLSIHSRKCRCPNCGTPQNLYEAARVDDIDQIDVGSAPGDGPHTCVGCGRGLKWTIPLMGDVHWTLVPIKREVR